MSAEIPIVSPDERAALPLPQSPVWLGSATVTAVGPLSWELRLPTGARVAARPALSGPYEPRVEDVVLAIGNDAGYWVIGVVHGSGTARLEVKGDLEVHATGALRLSGDKGVEVRGPEVAILATKLRAVAETATQTFAHLRERVTELWSVQAGRRHTVVEGASHEQAKSATILTEEKMTINGKAIYLG